MGTKSTRHPSGMLSIAVLATAGVLASVSVAKVARVFVISSRLTAATQQNLVKTKPDPAQVEKALAPDKAAAEELKKANLFAPPAPKRNPVQEVPAIVGDMALINGQWYKAGDKVQDANIVAIQPTHVVVEWNGERTDVYPIQAAGGGSPSGPGSRGPRAGGRTGGPTSVIVGGPGRGGPMGGFFNMAPEERQRMFEQFRTMSPEQRQAMREQMRGGRGRGSGPEGGGNSENGGGRDRRGDSGN